MREIKIKAWLFKRGKKNHLNTMWGEFCFCFCLGGIGGEESFIFQAELTFRRISNEFPLEPLNL